jgi:fumarate reductase flavoprotein subunit
MKHTVIVVGGGGSGLAAACAVAERGGRVLVLEKQPFLGGTTGIAVGTLTAAGTSLQRQRGIVDDPLEHDEDAGKFAPQHEARNNGPLRRFFLREAATTFEWLRGLGLTFHGPNPEPPNRVPRMHNVVPGAKAYIAALQYEVQRRGGDIRCGADVVGLEREGERVVGVRVLEAGGERAYRAERGVVIAAGDYANNADMIRRYKGPEYADIEGINPHATGAGHRLAEEAGGVLVNMDITYGPELRFVPPARKPFQQVLPTGKWATRLMGWAFQRMPKRWQAALVKRLLVTWQHPENALFDDGAILLNAGGDRFVDEKAWPAREIAVARQPGKIAYLLLDRRLCERYSAWPHFISTAPEIAYAYVKDYERLRPDVTTRAAELDQLGPLANVADNVRKAVASSSLSEGPWVLLGPVKAYFTTTEGGVLVNERMQVLNSAGDAIAGLYAVGQVGLAGMMLFGHGLHIAWAMTSGRLAGAALMEHRP